MLRHKSQPSIEDMGISEFRSVVFLDARTKPRAIQGACDLMNSTRRKQQISGNETLLTSAVEMFRRLGIYSKEFEPHLIAESERFFLAWADEITSQNTLARYIKECQELFKEEAQICALSSLEPLTTSKLQSRMEDILIEPRQKQLLKIDEISLLLQEDNVIALKELYNLLQRKRLGERLSIPFEAFIVKQGSNIVFDEERENDMIVRLLEFKRKLDRILEQAFETNEVLGHTLREAFETFINKPKRSSMTWGTDNPKPGEMIAKYVDIILKGGKKAIPGNLSSTGTSEKRPTDQDMEMSSEDEDVEITKQLDQVLDFFRFVHGKAVFEAFYKRDLARRLLLGRSSSADAEKSMLTRLKSGKLVCASGCTFELI